MCIFCDYLCLSMPSRNLYWADSKLKRLEVAMLDGRYRKHLVKTELGHPSAVAVNPRLGWERQDYHIKISIRVTERDSILQIRNFRNFLNTFCVTFFM